MLIPGLRAGVLIAWLLGTGWAYQAFGLLPAAPGRGPEPGQRMPALALRPEHGAGLRLGAGAPCLLHFADPACPISARALPIVERLAARYAPRGLRALLVTPTPQSAAGLESVLDADDALAHRLGIPARPYVCLVDAAGHLCFRGGYEALAGCGRKGGEPVEVAISALLSGKTLLGWSPAVGCQLD